MVLNLSTYIYSLLLENETVIIPGFGAFVSTYNPAVILENEIKPPSKEISFNQQIKNNDGMLAEIIARRAKISQSYAMKRIEKARENMLYELDKGETVIVEKIGTLVYNENNDIIFVPFQDENMLLNSFGLETISTGDSIQKTDVIEVETAITEEVVKPETIDENESEPVSTTKEEESETKIEALNNSFVEKESELNQEEEPEKIQITEFNTVGKPERQEKKKKVGWYWYLLILIPIFIGGFFILNNKSETKETVINAEEKVSIPQQDIQSETIISSDSVENNSLEPVESDSVQKINTESELSNGASTYYVVGGGFKEEENIEKFILKLKDKGINGFNLGQKGSLYLVGVGSFDNEMDAQELLNKLVKANPGWNLWIYEK
jgi:nucleoid DNA-binding protein/cell division septation protein DedD